jgi:hypothetical protein
LQEPLAAHYNTFNRDHPAGNFRFLLAISTPAASTRNEIHAPAFPSRSRDVPLAVRRLVESCWAQNPKARPSAGDLLQKLVVLLKQLD